MEEWNAVILIHPYKFVAELVKCVWRTSASQPNHVGSLHEESDPLPRIPCWDYAFYRRKWNVLCFINNIELRLHIGQKPSIKISLGFGLKRYCSLPPMDFGIFFLWYSKVKARNPISSPERANCKSHYKSEPPVWLQQSSFRFNDAEPSWSVKRKQTSAIRFVLYHWRAGFQPSTSGGKLRWPLSESYTRNLCPFQIQLLFINKSFFHAGILLSKGINNRHTHILKIHGLQYDMNICLSALLVWAPLWFLSNRNTFIVKIEI